MTDDKLRFDFSYKLPLTAQQLKGVDEVRLAKKPLKTAKQFNVFSKLWYEYLYGIDFDIIEVLHIKFFHAMSKL